MVSVVGVLPDNACEVEAERKRLRWLFARSSGAFLACKYSVLCCLVGEDQFCLVFACLQTRPDIRDQNLKENM